MPCTETSPIDLHSPPVTYIVQSTEPCRYWFHSCIWDLMPFTKLALKVTPKTHHPSQWPSSRTNLNRTVFFWGGAFAKIAPYGRNHHYAAVFKMNLVKCAIVITTLTMITGVLLKLRSKVFFVLGWRCVCRAGGVQVAVLQDKLTLNSNASVVSLLPLIRVIWALIG